jgi:hypothetical protein
MELEPPLPVVGGRGLRRALGSGNGAGPLARCGLRSSPVEREVGWLLLAREPRQTVEQAAWVSMGSQLSGRAFDSGLWSRLWHESAHGLVRHFFLIGYNLQHTPRHSVLSSIPRFLKKFGSLKMETNRFSKILRTDYSGFWLFRFGSGSNRTFLGNAKTMINMHVLK